MISQTEENYLKALFTLTGKKGETSVNEVGKHLGLRMPTVNSMMKRLAEKGFVMYESYKPLRLTESGKKEAALIIRKHRLTEMYLVEKMGFGWEEVHDIAEQVEHIRSESFFAKMDELLGYPKVDPHGSPIPDIDGRMESEQYVRLSDCTEGSKVTFMAVGHSSEALLNFLNNHGLVLGSQILVDKVEPFDDSMTVSYGERKREMFSSKVCEKLLVKAC